MRGILTENNNSANRPPLLTKAFTGAGSIVQDAIRGFAPIIGVAVLWRRCAADSLFRLDVPVRVAPQFCPMVALLAVIGKSLAGRSVSWNNVPDRRNFC